MFTTQQTFKIMQNLFKNKKYDKINQMLSLMTIEDLKKINMKIFSEIHCILRDNVNDTSPHWESIKHFLNTLESTAKDNNYKNIIELLFEPLLHHTAYKKMIDYSFIFIKYIENRKESKKQDSIDLQFLSKIYNMQGKAYHKLGENDLAKQSITTSLSILKEEKSSSKKTGETNIIVLSSNPHMTERQRERHVILGLSTLADTYQKNNNDDAAINQYDNAINRSLTWDCVDLYHFSLLKRGFFYLKKESLSEALNDFKTVFLYPEFLEKNENDNLISLERWTLLIESIIHTWFIMLDAMRIKNEFNNMIKHIKVIQLLFKCNIVFMSNDKEYIYCQLFLAHLSLQQYSDALLAISHLIKDYPHAPEHYLSRARLYVNMNSINEARKDLETLKQLKILDPDLIKNIEQTEAYLLIKELAHLKIPEKKLPPKKPPMNFFIPKHLQPHKLPVTDKKSKKNKKKKKSLLIKQSASEQKKKIRAEKHEKIRLKKEKSLKNTLHEQAVSDTKQIVMKIVNNSIHLAEEREKNVAFSKSIVNGMLDRAIQISDTKKIVMKIVENSIHVAEEHAKNLAFSKPIVNGILDRVIQLSEEKKLSEKKVNSLPKPFIQPSPPPNHISLLKTIMTDAEFKTFDLLIGKIPSTSARIWMTGSSVILYFLNQHKIYHKLFNNDIDIQIYTSMKNLQQIQRIVVESDFEYKTASVEKGYMQFISKNKDKNTRGLDVTIINQDIYQPTYDPIEITRCKLEVFRRAQDHYSCYYDSDENVRYLHTAFSDSSENLLKINLTGDISNTERLFLRIIKNTKKYGTMLTQKLILAEQKNNGSYHSEWKKWLVSYFKNLQLTKSDSHYKEFDVLLKDCCFDNWRDILLTFFEILLGADRTSLAPANMVSIFYNFYDTYFCDQPLKSVIHEILEIVKGNSKLLTAQLSEFNLTTILIQLGQKLGCVLKTGPEVELETEVRERGFRRG